MVQAEAEAGRSMLEAGRWVEARAAFEAAVAKEASAEALHGLADALWWTGEIQASIDCYQRAYTAYRQEGNALGCAWAAVFLCVTYKNCLGNGAAAAGWLSRGETAVADTDPSPMKGWFLSLHGMLASDSDLQLAVEFFQQALKFASSSGDRDLDLIARADLGVALTHLGQVEEGFRFIDEAMAGISAGEHTRLETVVFVCCIMLTACDLTANLERANQWSHVTDRFLAEYGCPFLYAECSVTYGGLLVANGRWDEAEQELRSAIKLTSGVFPPVYSNAIGHLASLKLRQGQLEEAEALLAGLEYDVDAAIPLAATRLARGQHAMAIALLERALRTHDEDSIDAVRALELLVEAHVETGDLDAAATALARLEAAAEEKSGSEAPSRARAAAGRLAHARGETAAALGHFEKAVRSLTRIGLPYDAARIRLAIAEAAIEAYPDLAALEAQGALASFEALGAAADGDRAAALLRRLGVPSKPGPRRLGLLTDRETEVLRLLSSGLSNPQIADRLVISRKTAAHHVSSLLFKLGVHTRAEAVAYASRVTEEQQGK